MDEAGKYHRGGDALCRHGQDRSVLLIGPAAGMCYLVTGDLTFPVGRAAIAAMTGCGRMNRYRSNGRGKTHRTTNGRS